MPFLTIFSAPKPFTREHIATIQDNAIRNWQCLGDVEVILLGDEEGMAEAAANAGIRHIREVQLNDQGTPLVSDMFQRTRQESNSPYLMCVNADMLFLPDLMQTAHNVAEKINDFLIVGQRWDLDVKEKVSFSEGWEERLASDVCKRGRLHLPAGSDYFIFPRHLYLDMPEFAIGRSGWDNWMIFQARRQAWPVIDATYAITAIHQDHDYGHLPDGKPHYNLAESQRNIELAGGAANLYTILDADRQVRNGKITNPRPTLLRTLRRIEVCLSADASRKKHKTRFQVLRNWSARRFRRLRRRLTGSL